MPFGGKQEKKKTFRGKPQPNLSYLSNTKRKRYSEKLTHWGLLKECRRKGSFSKLDGVGPVDNRPSSNELNQFVKKKALTHDMS